METKTNSIPSHWKSYFKSESVFSDFQTLFPTIAKQASKATHDLDTSDIPASYLKQMYPNPYKLTSLLKLIANLHEGWFSIWEDELLTGDISHRALSQVASSFGDILNTPKVAPTSTRMVALVPGVAREKTIVRNPESSWYFFSYFTPMSFDEMEEFDRQRKKIGETLVNVKKFPYLAKSIHEITPDQRWGTYLESIFSLFDVMPNVPDDDQDMMTIWKEHFSRFQKLQRLNTWIKWDKTIDRHDSSNSELYN